MSQPERELYNGFALDAYISESRDGRAGRCSFTVSRTGVEWQLSMEVWRRQPFDQDYGARLSERAKELQQHWLYIGNDRELKPLAYACGRQWVHGLIDLGRYRHEARYTERRNESWNPLFGEEVVTDDDLRRELLQALRRMQRAQHGRSQIFELDVDGVAAVLGIDPLRVRGVLGELIIEGLVESYAATFGRGAEDGACRITGEGLRELRTAELVKAERRFITVDEIDSFAAVRGVSADEASGLLGAQGLVSLSESEVKAAICRILGEPTEFKDWPGERSDIFTTRVHYQGRRIPTAFLLKGPAVRPPLYIAHLGKRGDQGLRLFTEPAELFIVQYNGPIDSSVHQLLWLLADRQVSDGKPATVCVMDGTDTARLLLAYHAV